MKFFFIISLIFLCTDTFSQVNDEESFISGTYHKNYIISNNIKAVKEEYYLNDQKSSSSIFYFNKKGILEKRNTINKEGVETTAQFFRFNEQGDLVMMITAPEDTMYFYKEYIGYNMVRETLPYSNISVHHYYDEKNRKIRSENPYYDGSITLRWRVVKNFYDDNNRKTHVTDQILNGSKDSIIQWMSDKKIEYKDDKMKKVVERINSREFLQNQGNIEYNYDKRGYLISFLSDAVASKYYKYDNKGRLSEKTIIIPEDEKSGLKMVMQYSYIFWD